MRTTIRLDDELLRQAKRLAAERNTTLTALIEDALRQRLQRESVEARSEAPVRLRTFGNGGVRPGVDLDDSAALLEVMDESR